MSDFQRVQVTPEIPGATAPTPEQKPAAQEQQQTTNAPAQQQQTQEQKTTEQRPTWLPEKFKTPEDFAKSYAELEKKLSTAPVKPAEGEQKPGEQKPGEQKPAEQQQQQQSPQTEEKFKPFFEEFAKDGKLSDDSYTALEKQGIPRAVVDQYIRGAQADVAAAEARVYEAAGGKERYAEMTQWASTNLNPAEIKAFNDVLASGNEAQILLATQGLAARHTAAVGKPARLIHGNASSGATAPFKSMAEVTAAMSDKRYASDPAYRQEVADRLAVSNAI